MKTSAERAAHPKARLHRELVSRLRDFGSIQGAEGAWARFSRNRRLWQRVVRFGLENPERQRQLNRIAYPEINWTEVNAALEAGNKLRLIYELACGRASISQDAAGRYKVGAHGLKIVLLPAVSRGAASHS